MNAKYIYKNDAELLAEFTEEHINRHHSVEVGSGQYLLVCNTCARLVRVTGHSSARAYLAAAILRRVSA